MKFTLYKPNPKNTGSAFSFDLTKDKKGGGSLYNSVRYDLDQEQNAFLLDLPTRPLIWCKSDNPNVCA